MDDLDRLMDQPASTPAASDPIDAVMDGYMNEQAGAVRAGVSLAVDANPDEVARQKRIAKALDVPVAAVEADPAFAARQQKVVEVEKATAQAPALRQKFTDADFAKLAHDDLDNLSGFEQLIRSAKRGWAAGLRGWDAGEIDAAARGLNALEQRNPTNEPLRPGRNFTAADPATLSRIGGQYSSLLGENAADFARRTGQLEANAATGATKRFYETQGWGEAVKALASDPFEITGNVVLESLGIMAPGTPAIVAGGLTGGPAGAGAAVGATSYSAEYGSAIAEEMQKSGVDLTDVEAVKAFVATPEFAEVRRKASIKAAVIGAFDAATAGVAGVRLRPSATGNIAAQTGVQAAGGAAGEAAGSAASGQEINAASVLAEAIGEVPGALVDVTTQSGRNVIISRAKAEQAEADAKLVENLNQLATSSKVLQRDADTFEQFVAAAAEDGPADTVYVDGRMLMQSGMAPRLAELSPAVRDQLDRAIITGGDIAIPVAEYAARIAPTDIAPQLIDHLKFDPEGFTRAEAADFMANEGDALQAEVERMLTDRQDADTFRASQDVVKQDILSQLNTAGRFTPQVNEAYATLASSYSAVRAAQLGITPEAFHQQRGMRVQGEAVAGDRFDQTGKLVTDTPEFRNWFGESKVVDSDGKPLVVYHGTRADIQAFQPSPFGEFGKGVYFTTMPEGAASYADRAKSPMGLSVGPNVVPVFLSIKNPLITSDRDFVQKLGQDGLRELGYDGVMTPVNAWGHQQILVFDPTQIKSATGNNGQFNPLDPNILNQSAIDTDAFRQWAGTDEVIESEDINDFDFSGQGPFVMRGYHGTTNTFEEFNASLKGNMEGQFGAVNYFTSSEHDATENYAGEGPDLTQRIELKAERLSDELTDFYQEFDNEADGVAALKERYGEEVYDEDMMVMARNIVRQELHGGDEKVLEVYIKTERPFVVNDDRSPWFEIMDEGEIEALAVARVADNEGVTVDEIEASRDDYQDQIDDARYEVMDEQENPLIAAVQSVADKYDFDAGELLGSLYEVTADGSITHAKLEEFLRSNESLAYAENPENGDIIQSHMIGEIIQELGFDSIILKNADTRFKNMNMEHGTAHIHVFDANNTNIKSVDNAGEFDPTNPNIYHQPDGDTNRGAFSPATNTVTLLQNADLSTFLHESAHYFFESDIQLASELVGKARGTERKLLTDASAPVADGYVRMYRAESPTVSFDDVFEREGLEHFARPDGMRGQRYTDSKKVADYYRSSYGNDAKIYYVDVLADRLDSLRVADSEYIVEPTDATSADLTPGEQQIVDDVSRLLTWHGIQGDIAEQLRQWHTMDFEEQRSHHERTAESFEAYLFSGKAPSLELQPIFQRFRAWLVNVYKSLKDFLDRNPEAGKLTDEVRQVFDRMIATSEQIALAEQGRSMLPLFGDPAKSGMTPDEFAKYQAQGIDATNEAIQNLQAKGLRDLQWLANAKGRQVARLKREARALRAEAELEARREVMSQPVYRAWDFLTRKLGQEDKLPPLERKSDPDVLDPTIDSLFVAIAKLGGIRKDQVISEWGVDPKDIPQSGLFGKPVWRITDGLTLDGMAQALAQHGYLPLNEHGQYELNDLADKFLAELAGDTQFSDAHQPQDLQPGEQIANPGGLTAGRLDLAGLASIGVPVEVAAKLAELKMTAKEGLHPDLVAEMFGFTSGDELTRALAAAEKPKDAITGLADRLMLERHGELATPEAIDRAADAAIHNEARARFVATEYNALAKATGQRRVLASAAKDFAAQMIARLRIRDIRPQQYATAEVRAAKAAEKASAAGKMAEAAAEKRNQLVNTYATRAAYDAQDEVESGVRYLRRFDKPSKTVDPDYQDQIDALLERFDLRKISNKAADKRASLAKWLEAQREAGMEPEIPPEIENEANRKPYREMTLEEFRGLVDTVKQIEHLGRLKHKLLTAQDQRAFGVIVDEVSASIVENGGEARPVQLETPTGIRPWLDGFAAGHRKIASLVRQMDGGKDNGPLWRVFVWAMNEAGTREAVMNEQATERLAEIYKPMLEKNGGLTGAKVFIPEINDSLTRGGRLAVALNWGNPTNRMRVMEGDNWSEAQVKAVLDTLTGDEWRFVQGVWNFIDSFWPEIEAKERRVTGRAPEKVQALPFTWTTNDGETVSLDGGYYPIKYDSNRDDRAEKIEAGELAKDMMRGAFTRSTTRRGHTKARVESVKRPVKKTLDVITQHVAEVTHDLAWHEWLIDANRLLDAKPINQAIREHYGTDVIRTMKDALSGIATADIVPQTKVDQALLYLRANVSRSTMGFSLTTAFLQPFGLAQSMVRIGTPHVLRGMARWAGDAARFESSMTWIREKSDFMRLRSKTFNRELHEINGRVSKGHSKARTIYDASLFMLMQKMQLVADVPTWIGAYEKALAQGQDEASAVALADQAVLDSQGGGQTKDMAEFQRKHPFLTMFYSYFNTTLNLAAESTAATDFKNPLALAGWASDMAMLLVIPALAPAMLLALMRGDECEDVEECGKKLLEAQAGYLLNLMIGVREVSGTVSGFDYAGPPAGRIVQELSRTGTQVAQGEADEALATSTISLLGVSLGIPTTQILRSYRGWKAWEDGEAPASSVLLGPPPKE